MHGCMKSLALLSLLGLSTNGFAHVPLASQIIRFQPGVLRQNSPFSIKGSVLFAKYKMPYELTWADPMNYQVVIKEVSQDLLRSGATGPWILTRKGAQCALKIATRVVACPEPRAWAAIELSGDPERVAAQLVQDSFLSKADAANREVSLNRPDDTAELSKRRVRPNVGLNGSTPVAAYEIQGESFAFDTPGEEHPLLMYDSTFLSPLLARFKDKDEVVSIKASGDNKWDRRKGRNQLIVSSRLEVGGRNGVVAEFVRGEPLPIVKKPVLAIAKTSGDLPSLEESLTPEGQTFLRALILTH